MTEIIQVIVLGLLQGIAELFPISSLGHTVIIPAYLGWGNLNTSPSFLPIVVTLHLGTAVALIIFYWRDWAALLRAFVKTSIKGRLDADPEGKTIWLVIVGTIPVGLLGLFLQKVIQNAFFATAWPVLPSAFLFLNGIVLLLGERMRSQSSTMPAPAKKETGLVEVGINELSFPQAFLIGLAQSLALIPGLSRSGVTMVACLRARLNHEDALRFTFLLATPVILAAALLEVPYLIPASRTTQLAALLGGIVAGVAAFLSAKFLTRYFRFGNLTPFAYYSMAVGLFSFLFFLPLALGWFTLPWGVH
ncbi:MAG: undecaprenyl-diphosphate phosphatase [Ktedonobacterales bacterium]